MGGEGRWLSKGTLTSGCRPGASAAARSLARSLDLRRRRARALAPAAAAVLGQPKVDLQPVDSSALRRGSGRAGARACGGRGSVPRVPRLLLAAAGPLAPSPSNARALWHPRNVPSAGKPPPPCCGYCGTLPPNMAPCGVRGARARDGETTRRERERRRDGSAPARASPDASRRRWASSRRSTRACSAAEHERAARLLPRGRKSDVMFSSRAHHHGGSPFASAPCTAPPARFGRSRSWSR